MFSADVDVTLDYTSELNVPSGDPCSSSIRESQCNSKRDARERTISCFTACEVKYSISNNVGHKTVFKPIVNTHCKHFHKDTIYTSIQENMCVHALTHKEYKFCHYSVPM